MVTGLGTLAGCNGGASNNGDASNALILIPTRTPAPTPNATPTPNPIGLGGPAAGPCEAPDYTPLSKCFDRGSNNVTIGTGDCKNVLIDQSYTARTGNPLGKITIKSDGVLKLADRTAQLPLRIETTGIEVNGAFEIGSAACPIGTTNPATKVTITFTGPKPTICGTPNNDPEKVCPGWMKGIEVETGGRLELAGAKGVPSAGGVSWTHLSSPSGPPDKYGACAASKKPCVGNVSVKVGEDGATTVHLAADVSAGKHPWVQGDWITVATTSFNPLETEFVQLAGAPAKSPGGGSTITLIQPLKYYHFGFAAPTPGTRPKCKDPQGKLLPASFCDDQDHNWGVDERAEVGLISRNVKLTADTPSPYDSTGNKLLFPQPAGLHWGGEIKIWPKAGQVLVQGVEIEKFGKDQIGSYPLHFHMAGKLDIKPVVDANSIHHSYNKCITIHSTSNLTIQNNVCVRGVGHLYYEEMGDEEGIVFKDNLGLGAMSNNFGIAAKASGPTVEDIIRADWWAGDYLTNDPANKMTFNNYDGLQIPNTDNQKDPTRGSCGKLDGNGLLVVGSGAFTEGHVVSISSTERVLGGPCNTDELYFEPASGFWIVNPTTQLSGNSIGGCRESGAGTGTYHPAIRTSSSIRRSIRMAG